MKKQILILLPLTLTLLFSCASTQTGPTTTPPWFNDMPPNDVLWGIGTANQSSPTMAMNTAEARARLSVSRQIETKVQAMFTDYNLDAGSVGFQVNSSLQEDVSRQITNVTLSGARPVRRWEAPDGTWWVLVELRKADVRNSAEDVLMNQEAVNARFRAQEALDMLDRQLSIPSRPIVVDN